MSWRTPEPACHCGDVSADKRHAPVPRRPRRLPLSLRIAFAPLLYAVSVAALTGGGFAAGAMLHTGQESWAFTLWAVGCVQGFRVLSRILNVISVRAIRSRRVFDTLGMSLLGAAIALPVIVSISLAVQRAPAEGLTVPAGNWGLVAFCIGGYLAAGLTALVVSAPEG